MKKIISFLLFASLHIACSTVPSQLDGSVPKSVAAPLENRSVVELQGKPEQATPLLEVSEGPCPVGMLLVEGDYCPIADQVCLRWLPGEHPQIGKMRCAEFKKPSVCKSKAREHKRFCIDKFEWPNKAGEIPPVGINWFKAQSTCESVGKRLCTAKEWTFACEGEDMRPYPYGDGFHRDEKVCDQEHGSMNPDTPRTEWPKYNHAHPSGSAVACKSQFGVYDMTANVDEWVLNEGGRKDKDPFYSGLKGGYWTFQVRTRCRPMTTIHGPDHEFYQQGFRCCRSI